MDNKLRTWRAERRVSQMELAATVRETIPAMSRDRLWRIENGYLDPTEEERAALARALDTDETTLFPSLAEQQAEVR